MRSPSASLRTRRQALTATAIAGGVALFGSRALVSSASIAQQPRPGIGAGLAGGGTVAIDGGEAQFALFGSRITFPDDKQPTFFGRLRWYDPNEGGEPLLIESTQITEYGPIEGDKRARRMTGSVSVNGNGSYPFVLEAVDAGGPAPSEEADTISLTVGPGAADGTPEAATSDDFAYEVPTTELSSGDLQLVEFGGDPASA